MPSPVTPHPISFGRAECSDPEFARQRVWLATNGIGGFAAGTIGGQLTERYHGLLTAALQPPLGRTLLAVKFDETLTYLGQKADLFRNLLRTGRASGRGQRYLERFWLDGGIPTWEYALSDARLQKQVWMQQGENTTYIHYRLLAASAPLSLRAAALTNDRDYHGAVSDYPAAQAAFLDSSRAALQIQSRPGGTPLFIRASRGKFRLRPLQAQNPANWTPDFRLQTEIERGFDGHEHHLRAAVFSATLQPGESLTVVFSTQAAARPNGEQACQERKAYEQGLLTRLPGGLPEIDRPVWARLALAADQFIVARPSAADPQGKTVIAGYPWFSDWGRDSMISLPGLTLASGRPEVARSILTTFARHTSQGMLPNRFPDAGEKPEYNTVDATLWYFEAIQQYTAQTVDDALLAELFPVLEEIIAWHLKGTRYGIGVDPADGLLRAGAAGVQLTWMDVKIDNWVVTPRTGKQVEINALWYSALCRMSAFAARLGKDPSPYQAAAGRVKASFGRFWNAAAGCCYDVIDSPDSPNGLDASLRPNQIIAASLETSADLFSRAQLQSLVTVCGRALLTSHGLRSLAPADQRYQGFFGGDFRSRDGAYHQGTVWSWLIGPFAAAHLRAFGDRAAARRLLLPLIEQLNEHGLGTVSEVFDGDPPHPGKGCFAQAWGAAELLRVWLLTGAG